MFGNDYAASMPEKTCSKCHAVKPESDFYRRNKGKYACPECKDCTKAMRRARFESNPRHVLDINKKWRASMDAATKERERQRSRDYRARHPDRVRAANKAWIAANPERVKTSAKRWMDANRYRHNDYRHNERRGKLEVVNRHRDVPCTDCGGRFPLCAMDFDHREPEHKSFTISCAMYRPESELLAEIAKCDVVCSNCHRVRTQIRHHIRRAARRGGGLHA